MLEKGKKLPGHIAIIMDGNGRWAQKRGLPRIAGHRAGMKRVKEVTQSCRELGISHLTLFAFSTENWKRPRDEVFFLMRLPQEYLSTELSDLVQNNIQVRLIGDERGLPDYTRKAIHEAIEATRSNTGMVLSFALNYGGRAELVEAVRAITTKVGQGLIGVDDISPELIQSHLYTAELPDPDLLIRTSGELRISNFFLWQAAYTELYFTDVLWPDFTKHNLLEAIGAYQHRMRRYGTVSSE